MRLPFLNHKSKKGRIKNMKIQRDGKEYTLTAEEVMEAHEEFVTSFMVAELENSYDVPHKYSKDLAKEAYDMYADSSIYSEYDCMVLQNGMIRTLQINAWPILSIRKITAFFPNT